MSTLSLLPQTFVDRCRLDAFVERLQEATSQREVARHIESLSAERLRLWNDLHTLRKLPAEAESVLIQDLSQRFQAYGLLRETGRDCFTELVRRLRPTPDEDAPAETLLDWIAVYLNLLHSGLAVHIKEEMTGSYIIRLDYGQPGETLVDFLFQPSFLRALLHFAGFTDFELTQTVTMLATSAIPVDLLVAPDQLQTGADFAAYRLRIPVEQLQSPVSRLIDPARSPGTDMNARFVDDVMQRSARILQDKRELLTAVEYLNIANDELEREIRANKRELEMARNIQKGFVPRRIPDWNGLQFWVKFYPLTEVSGDFYDYFTIGSNKFGFMVCDVSGHGVPAALISAIAKLSFNNHRYDSPAEVFSRVNLDILNYVKTEGYLTGFYMLIDADYNIIYSLAAAPPPLLLRKRTGQVERLECKGTLIGMFTDAGKYYEDQQVRLEPGDKLFIFTDGLIEIQNDKEERLGEERLFSVIAETSSMDLKAAAEHVMQFYNRFHLGMDATDDLTLIAVGLSEQVAEFQQHISRARRRAQADDFAGAARELKSAHAILPGHTGTLFMLGRTQRRIRDFTGAIATLEEYNTLRPYNADSYRLMGECHLYLGNLDLARQHLEKSISLRPENPAALYHLGRLHLRLGRIAEAELISGQLQALRPGKKKTMDLQLRLRAAKEGKDLSEDPLD
ncbi:MAG: SpoIIE family protein phosphatase [Spirochaetales bacterium]|nr:SpoIIE family protein phosphatase [Spirochaetales bacterium]